MVSIRDVYKRQEEVNTLDIEKTKSYYNQIRNEDLCDCDYCRNNIHEVKAAYPTSFIAVSYTHLAKMEMKAR